MSSVADIPSEARCKQLVYELVTKQKHHECGQRIAWRYGRDYGWCRACHMKIRPKAITWFRGSKLRYRQLFCLLMAWQARRESWQCSSSNRTQLYYHPSVGYARFRQHLPSDGSELLSGVVAVDEAWFGKQRHSKRGKQTIVMGGIEVDTRRLRLQVIPDTEQDSIELFLETWVVRYNHSTGHFGMSNHIECIWSAMKRYLRKLYGCVPTCHLVLFLREWEARHNQRELFESPLAYLRATVVTD